MGDFDTDIRINRECIKNVRHQDDTVVFANKLEDLQKLANIMDFYLTSHKERNTYMTIMTRNN